MRSPRCVACGVAAPLAVTNRTTMAPAAPSADDILFIIETPEQWATVFGEEATKDMLFIVEVYAAWCGPAAAAISTYMRLKEDNDGKKFKLCKVCADVAGGEGEYLEKFKINARPTFLFFKDGEQVAQIDGVSMPTLEKMMHEHMPEGFMEDEPDPDADEAED